MSSPKLDLAFAMDCTASMGAYIRSAKENIQKICEEIVASEQAEVSLALVEYRDHPPEEDSFVTRVHDFTSSISQMRSWLDDCTAEGGGDEPEAVADALHDLLMLSWREGATKLAVLVSDAPPHGIGCPGDFMPKGCPLGHDPMAIAHQLAHDGVTLYVVGVEPPVARYRDFFMVLAHAAGGRYLPLSNAHILAKAIVSGAQEEISLAAAMEQVRLEVEQTVASDGIAASTEGGAMYEEAVTRRVHDVLVAKGITTKQMMFNSRAGALPEATEPHIELSRLTCLSAVTEHYAEKFGALTYYACAPTYDAYVPNYDAYVPNYDAYAPTYGAYGLTGAEALSADRMPSVAPAVMGFGAGAPTKVAAHAPAPSASAILGGSVCSQGVYSVEEAGVSYGQASRMVRKALAKSTAAHLEPPVQSEPK